MVSLEAITGKAVSGEWGGDDETGNGVPISAGFAADAYPVLANPQNCNRIFLATVMRSKFFLNSIVKLSSRTNMPKVNRKQLSGFQTPLPPPDLQERFAAFAGQVGQSKRTMQASVDGLKILQAALMCQYFAQS